MAKQQKSSAADYEEYDEIFEDDYWETRSRKPKPKKPTRNMVHGVVTRTRGHHYDVQTPHDTGFELTYVTRVCEVRGRMLQEKTHDTLVAVGDRVWFIPNGPDKGVIEQVEERHSVLSRQRPGMSMPAEDVILANPDQALVVFAAANPEPHLRMLDRFLVIAEANLLPVVICVNKVDLTGLEEARRIFGVYEEIGYRVLYVSTVTNQGMDELELLLSDRITVVTGPSGVGKSSLINTIHPKLNLQTGDLRDFNNKGRHTTRSAQLYPLPFGTESFIADTPGIRELGLYDIDPADLGFYFKDLEPYINDCRYPNCTHTHEPDCAVRAAVEAGKIAPDRYESYLRLLQGDEYTAA